MEYIFLYIACTGLSLMLLGEHLKRRKLEKQIQQENQPINYHALYAELGGYSADAYVRYHAALKICRTIKNMTAHDRTALADYEAEAIKELRSYRESLEKKEATT